MCKKLSFTFKVNSSIGEDRGVVALMPDRKVILSYQVKKWKNDLMDKAYSDSNSLSNEMRIDLLEGKKV